jgi:hypothetical protein
MSLTVYTLPRDVFWRIGSFQSARELLRMSQTCTELFRILQTIIQHFARTEQDWMQIPYFCRSLAPGRVAWEWGQLSPERRRIARTNLAAMPLVFYSGRFDDVTVLLSENVLEAMRNPRDYNDRVSCLIHQENEIPRARILINAIQDRERRSLELSGLALREKVPFEMALEMAGKIPHPTWKSWTLCKLAINDGISRIRSLEIAMTIPDEKMRERTLKEISEKDS